MTRVALVPAWLAPNPVPGVEVHFWDSGQTEPDTDILERVEFFVPPYMGPAAEAALAQRMPRLRVVQALMAGVDGIAAAVPADVQLLRAAGVHDTSTAELAVGLMIAAQRGIDVAARDMTTGTWRHERRRSLAESHVGIVGWGGVGRAIARRLEGFEVQVTGFSRSGSQGSHPIEAFDETSAWLDIVVLALPLTPQTEGFMDASRMDNMATGALLVNVGRGALVDTDALVSRARSGRLRSALDVTDPEPLPPDHELWTTPGVLITPHLGGNSEAFVPRAQRMVERQLQLFAAGVFD